MNVLERIGNIGIVPVVVIEDAQHVLPTADALIKGGIGVMEITLRTKAGLASIEKAAAERPDMLVGAGTVLTLEQCKVCVQAGAKFIVSPGFDYNMVKWCVDNGVAVTPGCVTPTEVMQALSLGVDVLKFFPANVYGGLTAMKALSGPFGSVKFIPTGGVNGDNIGEYAAAPFIHAVGGSWLCTKADIAAGNFDKITQLCKTAVQNSLGFEVAHVGVNMTDEEAALALSQELTLFGFSPKVGSSSIFAGSGIELMKSVYLGENGHLAIRTNHIGRAIDYLAGQGYTVDMETAKYKGAKLIAVYLTKSFGGFAVHLLQK